MPHPNKSKGNAFENAVRKVFEHFGYTCARIKAGWEDDQGDLAVEELPQFVWQCKNYKDVSTGLRSGVDGASEQAIAAGATYGVAVIKRPRKKEAQDAYAVMPLGEFISMIKDLTYEDETTIDGGLQLGQRDDATSDNDVRPASPEQGEPGG